MNMDQKKWSRVNLFLCLLCLGMFWGACAGRTARAAENPAYTVAKGKKVTILNIVNKNPLTAAKKSKYQKLTWKSKNKKIVKIIKNKKLKGVKKGSTYVRGYNSKKKKVLAI